MINRAFPPALAPAVIRAFGPGLAILLCATAPGHAVTSCSGGQYAADAEVIPPEEIGTITLATQWAWNGQTSLEEVCNLLTDTSFFATWSLFSGEVDTIHGGICVSLSNSNGDEWFSCQPPEAVAAAFAAVNGTPEAILGFDTWEPFAPGTQ